MTAADPNPMMLLLQTSHKIGIRDERGGVCVGSFGERLQREREMRGITLEEIAEATKIGTRSLRALESEDFDKLPGGIFNKGFVRAYSKYLGIDEEQAVADYMVAVNEADAAGRKNNLDVPGLVEQTEEPERERISFRIPWIPLLACVVLIAAIYAGRRYYAQHGWPGLSKKAAMPTARPEESSSKPLPIAAPQTNQPGTAAVVAKPMPPPTVVTPSGAPLLTAAPKTAPAARTEPGFVVQIRVREDAWISITADGEEKPAGILTPKTEKTIHAMREVVLKTGNAGGMEISFNGKPLPPVGVAGEVRTITFGPEGIRP